MDINDLPDRRTAINGVDLDGNVVVMSFSIAKNLYRCPGCHAYIQVGEGHVFVRIKEPDGESYHQHWHSRCAAAIKRELRSLRTGPPLPPPRRRR